MKSLVLHITTMTTPEGSKCTVAIFRNRRCVSFDLARRAGGVPTGNEEATRRSRPAPTPRALASEREHGIVKMLHVAVCHALMFRAQQLADAVASLELLESEKLALDSSLFTLKSEMQDQTRELTSVKQALQETLEENQRVLCFF
jgi:hypothetical protein